MPPSILCPLSFVLSYAHDEYIVNPVQSARMRTSTSFSFTYGRVEVRAQVPKGDWLWPGTALICGRNFL